MAAAPVGRVGMEVSPTTTAANRGRVGGERTARRRFPTGGQLRGSDPVGAAFMVDQAARAEL